MNLLQQLLGAVFSWKREVGHTWFSYSQSYKGKLPFFLEDFVEACPWSVAYDHGNHRYLVFVCESECSCFEGAYGLVKIPSAGFWEYMYPLFLFVHVVKGFIELFRSGYGLWQGDSSCTKNLVCVCCEYQV